MDKEKLEKLDETLEAIHQEEETKEEKKKLWDPEIVLVDGEQVEIGGRKFKLVYNHRDAFDAEKIAERFSDILSRYDYVVGDWGFEQLRLKGFFNNEFKKAENSQKIEALEDYLYEYCNFGCAFFVLERLDAVKDRKNEWKDDFQPKKKQKKNRNRRRNNNSNAYTEEKVYSTKKKNNKKVKPYSKKKENQKQREMTGEKKKPAKREFVIRQKEKK